MAKPGDDYPFEQFPRGEIQFKTSRRMFLSAIMTEVRVYNQKTDGHISRKLSDLGAWPDEDLLCIVPMIIPESEINVEGKYITGAPAGGRPVVLFASSSPAVEVYNLFDGVNTLDEIADTLARKTGWTPEKSFAYTRGVFLSLVMLGLCRPTYSWRI